MIYHELLAQAETVSDEPLVRERYIQMRMRGESHNMAEVLALRKAPLIGQQWQWVPNGGSK